MTVQLDLDEYLETAGNSEYRKIFDEVQAIWLIIELKPE